MIDFLSRFHRRKVKKKCIATVLVLLIFMCCHTFWHSLNPCYLINSLARPHRYSIVFPQFEHYENDILNSVKLALHISPGAPLFVICDHLPYPPLHLPSAAVVYSLEGHINKPPSSLESLFSSEYLVILPDATEILSKEAFQWMIQFLRTEQSKNMHVKIAAWNAYENQDVRCLSMNVSFRTWTLSFRSAAMGNVCDALSGHFALVIRTADFMQIGYPFLKPFGISFFVQTAHKGWKVALRTDFTFRKTRALFTDSHLKWKKTAEDEERQQKSFEKLGIKLVKRIDGDEEWYGCNKRTARCFPSIVKDRPSYVERGRYTPPCCLAGLRATFHHVLAILTESKVRYWLEGGSLLGAARSRDIIPWDYDVDIGIYKDDVQKVDGLRRCKQMMYEDEDGFVWQRASEGGFYRVQYSQKNHLHVDIFPFYLRNGTMTKDSWIAGHKQDREFPEKLLLPLKKTRFTGKLVNVPANMKKFLEFKFGKGVIEHPIYPGGDDIY